MTYGFQTLRIGQRLDNRRSRNNAEGDAHWESRSFNSHYASFGSRDGGKVPEGEYFVAAVDGHDDKAIFEASSCRRWERPDREV